MHNSNSSLQQSLSNDNADSNAAMAGGSNSNVNTSSNAAAGVAGASGSGGNMNSMNSSNPQLPIIRKRRDAMRLMKIHESNGHKFVAKFFSQPTFCSFCAEFLWYHT